MRPACTSFMRCGESASVQAAASHPQHPGQSARFLLLLPCEEGGWHGERRLKTTTTWLGDEVTGRPMRAMLRTDPAVHSSSADGAPSDQAKPCG